ncbi:hypothetical protein FEM48_Zijuj01G0199300 [Ziziphus jujuba var. spinosa]|uniref:C3H1-type domain-containing protein n=1 Tax=Ziziphus jujuba var. spinosa TaxID=714518 RepID=A0A978W389_ZIZJJ|nr:hypothetical protein FEM48_Zijuj01G0199300 [Ziziphus jujuba var. spinosa]
MEEELLKRNTDCVYFLASPLTCKKGIDCEYRHSEIARLNPRDCWYWLAGNCLNPACAFRHPPLDSHAEESSETSLCSQSVNKTSIPCYFYFNGFCNKGGKCCFLHGVDFNATAAKPVEAPADGNAPTGKSVNAILVNSDPLLENKESTGTDTVSAQINTHLSSVENANNAAVGTRVQPTQHFKLPVPNIVPQQRASPEISVSEDEEPGASGSDSLLVAEGFVQSISHECTDHSSEEEVDDHIDPDERWESSPGFDVLVNGKSENMNCEDDPEYFMALSRDQKELNSHFLGYEFENPIEYDPTYRDVELIYDSEVYDSYDRQDRAYIFGNIRNIPGHDRDKVFDTILSRKRKLVPMELFVDDQNCVDLRNHLRRRRLIGSHPVSGLSRSHESSLLIHRRQERRQRHGIGRRRLHGNLASALGKHTIESVGKNGTLLNGGTPHGSFRRTQQHFSRKHYKEKKRLAKRQFPSSEISRKPIRRERIHNQESNAFSGPKTLAQIKEEKRKAEANGDWIGKVGHSSRITLADFEGPKPLSEIMKDKRKIEQ